MVGEPYPRRDAGGGRRADSANYKGTAALDREFGEPAMNQSAPAIRWVREYSPRQYADAMRRLPLEQLPTKNPRFNAASRQLRSIS